MRMTLFIILAIILTIFELLVIGVINDVLKDLGLIGFISIIPIILLIIIIRVTWKACLKWGKNKETEQASNNSINKPQTIPEKVYGNTEKNNAITEIDEKITLLFKSYKNGLLTKVEFEEKTNKLDLEKIKIIGQQKEAELKSLALINLKDNIKELKGLQENGLLTELEYQNKFKYLLNTEVTRLKERQAKKSIW